MPNSRQKERCMACRNFSSRILFTALIIVNVIVNCINLQIHFERFLLHVTFFSHFFFSFELLQHLLSVPTHLTLAFYGLRGPPWVCGRKSLV